MGSFSVEDQKGVVYSEIFEQKGVRVTDVAGKCFVVVAEPVELQPTHRRTDIQTDRHPLV